jgi:hypothetical protein
MRGSGYFYSFNEASLSSDPQLYWKEVVLTTETITETKMIFVLGK